MHIPMGKQIAESGLGKDEPSNKDKDRMVSVAEVTRQKQALKAEEKRLAELKDEIKTEAASVADREQSLADREAEIEAREAALQEQLAALGSKG
jgi:uncharacterized protein YlxW (UPF0749 family)